MVHLNIIIIIIIIILQRLGQILLEASVKIFRNFLKIIFEAKNLIFSQSLLKLPKSVKLNKILHSVIIKMNERDRTCI